MALSNRVVLTLSSLTLACSVLCAAGPEYRVSDVAGRAAILPKGSSAAAPVVKGLLLQPGDRLITSGGSRVEVASNQGTVLELKENSYCRLQSVSPRKTSLFLKMGRMLAHFAPEKETKTGYRVRTPTAVAAVRGTELGLSVDDAGDTEGGVIEGRVDFSKPLNGPSATMNWSDEDPKWDEEEAQEAEPTPTPESSPSATPAASPAESVQASTPAASPSTEGPTTVVASEGISAHANKWPEKLPAVPRVIVAELAWFASVRDRVPKLRDEWKDLDLPSQMKMRQAALRERITWQIPPKLQPARVSPQKISPKKHEIPKPR